MINLKSIRDIHRLIQNYAEERTQLLTKDVPTKPEQWDEIYTYLKALTNLYGVVPIDKVTEILNAHHDQQIDSGDLRYIDYDERSKEVTEFIGINGDYFFNLDVLIDDNFDSLLKSKEDKPYYVPDKEEIKRYASRDYFVEDEEFIELRKFIRNKYWNKKKADRLALEIQILSKNIDAKDRMDNFFDRHRLKLSNNELKELKVLIQNLMDNTRLCENNGFTPREMNEES